MRISLDLLGNWHFEFSSRFSFAFCISYLLLHNLLFAETITPRESSDHEDVASAGVSHVDENETNDFVKKKPNEHVPCNATAVTVDEGVTDGDDAASGTAYDDCVFVDEAIPSTSKNEENKVTMAQSPSHRSFMGNTSSIYMNFS